MVLKNPAMMGRVFYPFFCISFAKYNRLLKKIHSTGGILLRLPFPAGLWDEYCSMGGAFEALICCLYSVGAVRTTVPDFRSSGMVMLLFSRQKTELLSHMDR